MAKLVAALTAIATPAFSYQLGAQDGPAGYVEDHNYYRCMHGAEPVMWDNDLAVKAQAWAVHIASLKSLTHSSCYSTWPYSGENLASGYGNFVCPGNTAKAPFNLHCAMRNWYEEYTKSWQCKGDFHDATGPIGHFKAMVWKGINRIGCGSSNGYYVCEYGHSDCKVPNLGSSHGGSNCWGGVPSKLANFNQNKCGADNCVACFQSNRAAICAAKTSPTFPGGTVAPTTAAVTTRPPVTSTAVATSTTPAPTSSSNGSPLQARLQYCNYPTLVRANQKCQQLSPSSYCQILAPVASCVGFPDVSCGCDS